MTYDQDNLCAVVFSFHFSSLGFSMSTSQPQFITADDTRLSILFREAADLDLQLYELNKLRYRVRQAQKLAWKSRPPNRPEKWGIAIRNLKTRECPLGTRRVHQRAP
jgi:hypothetical protein